VIGMDVEAALEEARSLSLKIANSEEPDTHDVDRFVELFDAIDGWMTRGGFAPAGWSSAKR
jgi:hypothetical protein